MFKFVLKTEVLSTLCFCFLNPRTNCNLLIANTNIKFWKNIHFICCNPNHTDALVPINNQQSIETLLLISKKSKAVRISDVTALTPDDTKTASSDHENCKIYTIASCIVCMWNSNCSYNELIYHTCHNKILSLLNTSMNSKKKRKTPDLALHHVYFTILAESLHV